MLFFCFSQVKPEDLKMFDNVAYIDACINSLTLGDYSYISYLLSIYLLCLLQKAFQKG